MRRANGDWFSPETIGSQAGPGPRALGPRPWPSNTSFDGSWAKPVPLHPTDIRPSNKGTKSTCYCPHGARTGVRFARAWVVARLPPPAARRRTARPPRLLLVKSIAAGSPSRPSAPTLSVALADLCACGKRQHYAATGYGHRQGRKAYRVGAAELRAAAAANNHISHRPPRVALPQSVYIQKLVFLSIPCQLPR